MKNIHVHSLLDANGKFHAEQGFPIDANGHGRDRGENGHERRSKKRYRDGGLEKSCSQIPLAPQTYGYEITSRDTAIGPALDIKSEIHTWVSGARKRACQCARRSADALCKSGYPFTFFVEVALERVHVTEVAK